jgi:8-oxo-dGTP pyrophosphatase MutT (NUDIX family)
MIIAAGYHRSYMTDSAAHAPAPARPASTVVVLREPFEVLMVKRNDKVAFMAGAYVFPGGRVDEGDREPGAGNREPGTVEPGTVEPSRFADLNPIEDAAYRRAAVRELMEEANVRLAPGDLEPFAHWVTPEIETRRYDTRFFLARMPERQEARHDDSETTAFAWLSPNDAIDKCLAGEVLLPPPTWTTLKQLAAFATVDKAFAWARAKSIPRVMPGFHKDESVTMLTLPGDPLLPTISGWDVPEETRFVLDDNGIWRAVKP